MRMFTSLVFMPDTLVLEEPDLCFFRVSNVPISGCVLVGGARGPDTLDQTTRALQRMEDATDALTLVESTKYSFSLLSHALDRLPDEFLPAAETYQESSWGRRPPLTPKQDDRIKMWYGLLAGARGSRNANAEIERALRLSIDSLTRQDQFKSVMLYSAFEEICKTLGGTTQARDRLKFTKEDRRQIERARRPIAHGGDKAKNTPERALPELQAEASESFGRILSGFLTWAGQTNSSPSSTSTSTDAQQSLARDAAQAPRP